MQLHSGEFFYFFIFGNTKELCRYAISSSMVMKHQMTIELLIAYQMTGSQRMTALYSKRGMKSRTKTILPRNSMTLDSRGSTFSPMLCRA